MRKVCSKSSALNKRGNLAMVMVISIAVVLTMLALCAFLVTVVRDQNAARENVNLYSNIDASINAMSLSGESQIKKHIESLKEESVALGEEEFVLNGNTFVNRFDDDLIAMFSNIVVVEYESISVRFQENVIRRVYGEEDKKYDMIVVSFVLKTGETYNIGFYAEETDGVDGETFQRGDYIHSWIA